MCLRDLILVVIVPAVTNLAVINHKSHEIWWVSEWKKLESSFVEPYVLVQPISMRVFYQILTIFFHFDDKKTLTEYACSKGFLLPKFFNFGPLFGIQV